MMTTARMPGNWPIREEFIMEEDELLFIPGLPSRGREQPTPNHLSIGYESPSRNQSEFMVAPLNIPITSRREENHDSRSQTSHSISPVSPVELFNPGLDLPAMNKIRQQTSSSIKSPSRELPELSVPLLNLQVGDGIQSSASTQPMSPSPSSIYSMDETFLDCPSPLLLSATDNGAGSWSSYLAFEPVVREDLSFENEDWRRFDPPKELLEAQEGTSKEIKSLLASSIGRIQARHAEEVQQRAAMARADKPLTRARRASIRPRRPSANGQANSLSPSSPNLHPTSGSQELRIRAVSNASLSPSDSGYYSTSPGTEPSTSPASSTRRSFGGLTALFKRKSRPTSQEFEPAQRPISTTSETTNLVPLEGPITESWTKECVSCLDEFATLEMVKLTCHSYCRECFKSLINTALESETHWPAKCCLNPIPTENILPHIDREMQKRYKRRAAEWSIPAGDRIYCSYPNCATWIAPKYINKLDHSAKCHKCQHRVCITCRGPYHHGADCPLDPSLQATIDLAELEGWKRCYQCHALVEHNNGCRHMTCRCKAQFCYICGLQWRTCGCTDRQLEDIQHRAQTRRHDAAVQTARQAAEAEEERIVLQMVADFVREEEEREAREIERRAREAEAQRRREEEERRRVEERRIAAVNLRFHNLGAELETLHAIQRVLIAERYEFESEVLAKQNADALSVLSIRHPAELHSLASTSATRISEAEKQFETEHQAKLAAERRAEDEYMHKLRVYYNGRPDAEGKIREKRDELRREHEKEYRFWDAYRRKQIWEVREAEKRKLELLKGRQESERKAAEGRGRIESVEHKRKMWAEGRWVEEVVGERGEILGRMEQEAYAGQN